MIIIIIINNNNNKFNMNNNSTVTLKTKATAGLLRQINHSQQLPTLRWRQTNIISTSSRQSQHQALENNFTFDIFNCITKSIKFNLSGHTVNSSLLPMRLTRVTGWVKIGIQHCRKCTNQPSWGGTHDAEKCPFYWVFATALTYAYSQYALSWKQK